MLNMSVKTKLDTNEALRRAYDYFVGDRKLLLVEWIAHMHADQGACEFRASGGRIQAGAAHDSKDVLLAEVDRLSREYGFRLAYYGLHIHASAESDVGHLMVAVHSADPVEITFESHEMDFPVKQFADGIPKA